MHLRIRTKFIGILTIAAVLPLCIALIAGNALGYRYYRQAQGILLETMAQNLAHNLSLTINSHSRIVLRWIDDTPLLPAPSRPRISRERFLAAAEQWPRLQESDPAYQRLVDPTLASGVTRLMSLGRFSSILIADPEGRLLAASRKPARFSQAHEPWWEEALRLGPGEILVRGLERDSPDDPASITIIAPMFRDGSQPAAILRATMRPPAALSSPDPLINRDPRLHATLWGNGSSPLWQLGREAVEPLSAPLTPAAARTLTRERSGWTLTPFTSDTVELAGQASLLLIRASENGTHKLTAGDLRMIVHGAADELLAPVRRQLHLVGGAGLLLVAGCVWAGYSIATRKIIEPIEKLRAAAHAVAESAKLDAPGTEPAPPSPRASRILADIARIHTGDEIEELSREFGFMASRVLSYHQQLEAEIELKTSELQGDLKMARDFQEALMPHRYPPIPAQPRPGGLRLEFHHIYQPTSTVGGDFFDVIQLSENRAGIFIADVMGHGTRSALITAILRTLLQDFAHEATGPAALLGVVNTHFHDVVRQSNEFLFVSAFYLVIDVEKQTATYASAGHPAPLLAEGCRKNVAPLIEDLRDNPALGLFAEREYRQWSQSITGGDVFLLFTDGLYEATNAQGEEFGQDRMAAILATARTRPAAEITAALVTAVHDFLGPAPLTDDLCLVTVRVDAVPTGKGTPAPLPPASEALRE